MNTISCLFLDIGGVLLSKGWGHEFRQKAAEKFQLNYEEMQVRHKIISSAYEEGRVTIGEYLDRVIFNEHRDFTREEFKDYMFSLTTPDAEMISFIKSLKAKYPLKIIAVSNEGRELNNYRINTFDLDNIFDFFVSSCYVHIRKPDARIFKLALDGAHVLPENVVYIDDTQMHVDVAAGLGIKGICHKDLSTTREALAQFGLTIG